MAFLPKSTTDNEKILRYDNRVFFVFDLTNILFSNPLFISSNTHCNAKIYVDVFSPSCSGK